MKTLKVRNYHEMSIAGAMIIHEAVMAKLSRREHYHPCTGLRRGTLGALTTSGRYEVGERRD